MKKLIFILLSMLLCNNAFALSIDTTSVIGKALNKFSFSGYAMAGWEYNDKASPSNSFDVNKIIFITGFKLNKHFDALVMLDFRKFNLHELWVNYNVVPEFRIKVGQFKTPFSIENPISPSLLEVISGTSLVTNEMICGSSPLMMPGAAGRDVGITVYGDLFKGKVSYDLAIMNGAGRNIKDNNSQKDFSARLKIKPIEGLMLSGSTIIGTGNITFVETDGVMQPSIEGLTDYKAERYKRRRWSCGAEYKSTPFSARAEWMWGKDGNIKTEGCYVTAIAQGMGIKGLDFLASFDYLDGYNNSATGPVNRYTVGAQYWFFKKCRIQAGYYYEKYRYNSVGCNVFQTQVQVAF